MTPNLSTDVPQCLELLRMMHLIRYTEEQLAEDFAAGKTLGGVHLSIGQGAVAAGVCAHLTDQDQLASNHRGHGHFLAKGGDPKALFAEIYGKREGICGGMGSSMHVADYSKGIIGANGIVGAGLPISTGAAASGYRVVLHLLFVNFIYTGMDGIAYQMARARLMSGGQIKLPITIIASYGGGRANAAQHSDTPYAPVMNVGGIHLLVPANPADAKGLLKSAIRCNDPVIFLEPGGRGGELGNMSVSSTPVKIH